MRFRRRRADVGRYQDPPAHPLAPLDSVVADGVLISLGAVRLSAKNRVIMSAVRDRLDFDEEGLADFVRSELRRLADENDETAERVDEVSQDAQLAPGIALDVAVTIRDAHRRRPEVHRALAETLRADAADDDCVTALVADAAEAATAEITRALALKVTAQDFGRDIDYLMERAGRIRKFLDADFAELRRSVNDRTPETATTPQLME